MSPQRPLSQAAPPPARQHRPYQRCKNWLRPVRSPKTWKSAKTNTQKPHRSGPTQDDTPGAPEPREPLFILPIGKVN